MASPLHHIYAIRNLISRGASSDDSRITNSLIRHTLNMARATLLKRRMDKYDEISSSNYQKICVDLQDSNPTECSIPFDLPAHCRIRRSTEKIPQRIVSRWGSPTKVQYLDGRRIGFLSSSMAQDARHSLSRPDLKTSYFFQENYLYIIGNNDLKKVHLLDLFEDPSDADGVSTCSPVTDLWPIDGDLVLPLYQLTLEMLGISYKIPEDTTNNAQDIQTVTTAK